MLDWIEIQNYRLFNHLRVEGLGRVNLITGTNNVGKSALLEAINLHCNNFAPSTVVQILKKRGLFTSGSTAGAIINFGSLINYESKTASSFIATSSSLHNVQIGLTQENTENNGFDKRILVEINGKDVHYNIQGDFYFKSEPDAYIDSQIKRILSTQYVSTSREAAINYATLWNLISLKQDKIMAILNTMRSIDTRVELMSLVNNHIGKDGLQITSPDYYAVVALTGVEYPVLLSSIGEGVERVFEIALKMVNAANGVLLIDEIENGLHYTVQPKLWEIIFKLAEELNVQVFATTHSLDAVRAFSEVANANAVKDDGVIIKLFRKNDGEIKAIRFDEKDLRVSVEVGLELR